MKNIRQIGIVILLLFTLLSGCKKRSIPVSEEFPIDSSEVTNYAKGFQIDYSGEITRITILNPWKHEEVLKRYYLSTNKSYKDSISEGELFISLPLDQMALTSCTQIGFMNALKSIDQIVGISYPDRVYNAELNERIKKKEITDIGDPFNLNVEQLLVCKPDIVLFSGYNQDDSYSSNASDLGVSVFFINEWMEESVLARAEWIKVFGVLTGEQEKANHYFSQVVARYNKFLNEVENAQSKPKLLSGEDFRGSWYMPGGNNWMAKLYKEAGSDYPLADNGQSGSISFSIEEIYTRFSNADIWVNVDSKSLTSLKQKNSRYEKFKPFRNAQVYNLNKRTTSTSGNDFWETAVADPSYLLADFIKIFHPELLQDQPLTYIERLKP